ncbi:hypothetical protein MTP99_002078 [Tenebrio molitor]|nr:hypothetical protein MTP99_002078 [Tenebrio molitor]
MILLTKSPLVDKGNPKSRLKVDFIRQVYGLTEVTMLGLAIPFGCEKKGSVGKVVSYMSSKIRDPKTGESLGSNQIRFQLPPQELEAILLRNPKIKDVAVVGLPDEEAGELPLAFVVKNSDVNLTEDEVKDFLADKVSYHKLLRGGVRFIKEIPKSDSGKILKRKLSELLDK